MTKEERITELRKEGYGSCVWNGVEYILLQSAYIAGPKDSAYFTADAISNADQPDADGWMQVYTVRWEILDYDPECGDDTACDWENPLDVSIIATAKYNVDLGYSV